MDKNRYSYRWLIQAVRRGARELARERAEAREASERADFDEAVADFENEEVAQ